MQVCAFRPPIKAPICGTVFLQQCVSITFVITNANSKVVSGGFLNCTNEFSMVQWHKLYHAEFVLRGGSRIPQGKKPKLKGTGVPTYFLVKFPQKLHENEENWIGRREASKICLCRSATDSHRFLAIIQNAWRISPGSKNSQSLIL